MWFKAIKQMRSALLSDRRFRSKRFWLGVLNLVGLFLALAVWMSWPYLLTGFPYTHDGENHLARFMNYAAAVREGQIPPRFAPYVQSGFGFPVFHYNYPLANIVATPLIWLGLHPGTAFAALVFAAAGMGVVSVYAVLRLHWSRAASFFGVFWYVLGSYWATTAVFRGNIGELLMYGLVPLAVLAWYMALSRVRWRWSVGAVVVTAALFLAHNVLAVLIIPLLGLWTLSLAWKEERRVRWFMIWIWSSSLVLWFWLPAVLELSLVVLSQDSLATSAAEHVLGFGQIWFSPLRFGFSRPTNLDSLGFGLGIGVFGLLVTSIAWGVRTVFYEARRSRVVQFVWSHWWRSTVGVSIGVFLGIWLVSEYSLVIWNAVPALSILQFPWRVLFVVSLCIPVVAAQMWESVEGRWWLVVLLFLQFFWVSGIMPVDRRYTEKEYYLTFPHSTTTRNENRPVTFTNESPGEWQPAPRVASGSATVEVSEWLGSWRAYSVTVQEEALLVEPTVYFPGWETRVDGERVAYILEDPASQGLIAYRLAPRPEAYSVSTRFVENQPIRQVSDAIFVVSLLVGGVCIWRYRESL